MARKRSHECTNCGAALDIPEQHERYFRCNFCGSVLEDTTPPDQQAKGELQLGLAQIEIDTARLASYAAPAAKAAGVVTLVVIVVVLGMISAIGFVVFRAVDSAIDEASTSSGSASGRTAGGDDIDIFNYAAAAVVGSDDQTGADAVGIARGPDGARTVYIDLDADAPFRWSVPAGDEDGDVFARFVEVEGLVVVSSGESLTARNRENGAVAWEATLSDVHQPNLCTGCFRRFDDTVVTLTADGVISSRAAATGEERWSVTLTATPRQVVDFGGDPAVLDEIDGVVQLVVFGRADGEALARLPLSCLNPTFGDRRPANIFDQLYEAGSGVLHIGDPSFGPCVQRWDPPSAGGSFSAPIFEVPYEAAAFGGVDPEDVLVTDDAVFVGGGPRVDRIGLADGAVTRVLEVPDTEIEPVASDGTVAVVVVSSTRGSGSHQLRAVDLAAGNVKWTFDLESTDRFVPGGSSFLTGDTWAAELTSAGLSVLQYRSGTEEVVHSVIPLATGTVGQPTTLDLSTFGITARPSLVGWTGDRLHLFVDATLLELDATTGETLDRVP